MEQGITIDTEGFSHDVARFALLTGRSFGEELKVQARGVLKETLRVTPPFGRNGGNVSSARKAARNMIGQDLSRIFRPKKLKGSRRITHLFGKQVSGAPWTVPAPEKHTNLAALLSAHSRLNSAGRQARYKNAYFVDATRYFALIDKIEKRSGRLGGGWAEAAAQLHVPVPAFMNRHMSLDSAGGGLRMNLEGDNLFIVITNNCPFARDVADYVNRVERAVQTQRGKMERQLPYLLRRHEKIIN